MRMRSIGAGLVLLAAAMLLTACPSRQTIAKINADPGRYHDKEVAIVGTVTNSYGILDRGVYEVDDGTGRMWVSTTRGVPSKGTRVGVKGYVYPSLNIGSKNFGVGMEETDRRMERR
jgi:hypothetical protein